MTMKEDKGYPCLAYGRTHQYGRDGWNLIMGSTPLWSLSEKTLGSLMFDCLYFSQFWYGKPSLFILHKTLFSYNRLDIFIECPVPVNHLTLHWSVNYYCWICMGNCGYSFHL